MFDVEKTFVDVEKIGSTSKKCFDVEKWNVRNCLERVLSNFESKQSQVRGVNGRSKFVGVAAGPVLAAYRL